MPKYKMNKTHCINGHPLSGDNVYIRPNGQVCCRICQRIVTNRSRRKIARERRHEKASLGSGKPKAVTVTTLDQPADLYKDARVRILPDGTKEIVL